MASVRPGGEDRFGERGRVERGKRERERERERNRNRNGGETGSTSPSGRQRAGAQYARHSTPGPIGGRSSYGIDEETYGKISKPHQPNAPERFENWARDVLDRKLQGSPPTELEKERLKSGLTGYDVAGAAANVGGVVGLGNPGLGLGIQGVERITREFMSPEYQAGAGLAGQDSPVSDTVSSLASAAGLGGAAGVGGTVGGAVEGALSSTGQLFGDIRDVVGTGKKRAGDVFGSSGGSDRSPTGGGFRPPTQPTQGGFEAPDPFQSQYDTALTGFTPGV